MVCSHVRQVIISRKKSEYETMEAVGVQLKSVLFGIRELTDSSLDADLRLLSVSSRTFRCKALASRQILF